MPATRARILVLEANPLNLPQLRTSRELKLLGQRLAPAGFEVELGLAVEADEIQVLLREHRPDIVHFAGHGTPGGLVVETEDGHPAVIPIGPLAKAFLIFNHEHRNRVRLVVLNACYSKAQADVLARYVNHVIGMTGPVKDSEAIAFANEFYAALGAPAGGDDGEGRRDGVSVQAAFDAAVNQVELSRHGRAAAGLRFDDGGSLVDASPSFPAVLLPDPPGVEPHTEARFTARLSDGRKAYLRHWFTKTWATVSLADLSDREGAVPLVDIYVPLRVDFAVRYRHDADRRIIEWWAAGAADEAGIAAHGQTRQDARDAKAREAQAMAREHAEREDQEELRGGKLREWPDLGVGEPELQRILDRFQYKIWQGDEARDVSRKQGEGGESSMYMEAHDAASVQPRFVLVGDPGSGKTSFLRHLALCHAGELLRRGGEDAPERASLSALSEWLLGPYTPIYIELHDLVTKAFPPLPSDEGEEAERTSVETFWTYVASDRPDATRGQGLASFEWELRRLLESKSEDALFLFDGLDEVGGATDERRRQQIKTFVAAMVEHYPTSRFVITSRPAAYRRGEWAIDGFGRAELQLLSSGRVRELAVSLFEALERRSDASEADARSVAERQARALLAAIERRNIPEDMRGTALFFTLLAALWMRSDSSHDRDLPETRGALYRQAVDLLLSKWTKRSPGRKSVADELKCSPEGLRIALERMACTVHGNTEQRGSAIVFLRSELMDAIYEVSGNAPMATVLDYLERRAGILTSPDPGSFRFVHWSFQEHLAACELIHRPAAGRARRPAVAEDRLFPDGLVRRVIANPALWSNVAHLAADELRDRERPDDRAVLIVELVKPYLADGQHSSAAILALDVAKEHGLVRVPERYDRSLAVIDALKEAAKRLMTDEGVPVEDRARAGRRLAEMGDDRDGVGLRSDGLPDLLRTMCRVEPGTVIVEGGIGERTVQHAFRIARYPVTHAQYRAFVEALDGYQERRWWDEPGKLAARQENPGVPNWPMDNHPAENVSWYDAMAFCRWLTVKLRDTGDIGADVEIRLPTEAEWQLAAEGPDRRAYPWGPEYEVGRANVDESHLDGGVYLRQTTAVGMYPGGAAVLDGETIYDLSGNVWEWTLSERDDASHADLTNDRPRVVRGGSWINNPTNARAAQRNDRNPDNRNRNIGFRVVVAAHVPLPLLWLGSYRLERPTGSACRSGGSGNARQPRLHGPR